MSPSQKPIENAVNTTDVYRKEAFDIGFHDYFKDIRNNKISQVLNNRERNIKLTTITYRQLNSWEEQNLISSDREGKGWRRFSIMDALWIKIIQELREFGLPHEKLKITKESLSYLSENCGVSMPFLEFYTAFAIGSKMPVLLLVFRDGVAVPANTTQYKITRESIGIENHIHINLNEMLQTLFPNIDLKPKKHFELPVNVNEMELLAFLRISNYEKIEIRCKNGQMENFEAVERVTAKKRIQEILKEDPYQDIQIQQQGGKVTAIFKTVKKKFSKGSNPT